MIGRYTARQAPIWGHYYVRHWILTTLARVVPWRTLQGTGFASAALRVLGARVGKRVHIHRGVNLARGGWDLLDIGDDASIARDVSLRLVDLEDGSLVVGPIRIGRGAVVETRAGIDAGGVLGDGAHLSALSWVPRGTEIPAGQRWSGVPAQQADAVAPLDSPTDGSLSESAHGVASILSNFALGYGLYLFTIALPLLSVALIAGGDLLARLFGGPTDAAFFWGLLALVFGTGVVGLLCSAWAVRLLPAVKPGVYSRWGWTWIRMNLKTNAVAAAGRVLSGTLFWPGWLRLAGMRIGAGSEVSTIDDVVPERVALGAVSFLADGIYLGSPDVRDGRVGVGNTSLGDETFVGNHVVVPTGVQLPNDVLIGVCTVASDAQIESGSSWFGHPAFQLPRQRKAELSRALTHEPGVRRYLTRLFFETLRFALPVPPLAVLLLMIWLVEQVRPNVSTVEFMWGVLPLALLATGVSLCTLVLALKWVLLGKVRPGTHGLWSFWCCRWDLLYVAWGAWCRGILAALEGTLWLPWYLRAMGMRIGKRAVLGGGFAQVVDPDMIEIGDDATVNALFQAHTFEDRVLKMDLVRIGDRATVGADAVLFYGAHVAADVRVMPNSVVMKHEHLSAGRTYAGCPTEVR